MGALGESRRAREYGQKLQQIVAEEAWLGAMIDGMCASGARMFVRALRREGRLDSVREMAKAAKSDVGLGGGFRRTEEASGENDAPSYRRLEQMVSPLYYLYPGRPMEAWFDYTRSNIPPVPYVLPPSNGVAHDTPTPLHLRTGAPQPRKVSAVDPDFRIEHPEALNVPREYYRGRRRHRRRERAVWAVLAALAIATLYVLLECRRTK